MQKSYIDYNKMLEDFLNQPIREKIKTNYFTNISYKQISSLTTRENDKIRHLMMDKRYIDERKLDESYLFCVVDNKLKIIQYTTNYLLDELMVVQNFLDTTDTNVFAQRLKKVYWVNEKTKNKYIKKAERKNIDTIYKNETIGTNILNYVYDKKRLNYLGDRFGVENFLLDNLHLEDEETLNSKYIIVMNFDYNIIELYDSIPYELFQKGTANLEADSVYGCYFDDFNYQTFFDKINEI